MKEWRMEQCSGVDTLLTREVTCGELLDESEASKVRRAIARINYMLWTEQICQVWPELLRNI